MKEFDEVKTWHKKAILDELCGRLKKREFNALVLDSIDEINKYLLSTIPQSSSVGFGGSVTLRETGIDRLLKERGNPVLDHWEKGLSPEESLSMRKKQLTSDYFLTSINAITSDGRIVNIDGTGNRAAAMIFGPGHIIAITGYNKIAGDLDSAIARAKNSASAMNTKRGNMDTPCSKTGRCMDCRPPKTICRVTTIIDYKPMKSDFTVILTPLELGF